MKCNKCENQLETGEKFCSKCGQTAASETKADSEQRPKKKSIFSGIISVVVFLLVLGVSRYLTQGIFTSLADSTHSPTELAKEAVRQAKASTRFPSKLDEFTTLVDITAEQDAIRYHYVLSGIDTDSFSNTYLKTHLSSGVCQNKDTKNLLDRGVGMEYSYVVENAKQRYFVSLKNTDCF